MNRPPSALLAAIGVGLVAVVVGFAAEALLFGEVSGGGSGAAAGAAAVATYASRRKGAGSDGPTA